VERALESVGDTVDGRTGELLREATATRRRLGTTVDAAFLDSTGVLADVPSRRLQDAAGLFTLAAREGSPAGDALVSTGEHLEQLRRVEAESRRELARVTGTLANTAAVFGPLVGGATVALAGSVAGGGPLGGRGLPVAALGPALGAYVLILAAVLTTLATGLEHGLDRVLIGYRIGAALPAATATYLTAVVAAGAVL
jgi:hypothetical protein